MPAFLFLLNTKYILIINILHLYDISLICFDPVYNIVITNAFTGRNIHEKWDNQKPESEG